MLAYLYIPCIAIAFLASLPVHRLGIFPYRVISTIMALDLIIEIWAITLWKGFGMNNLPLYNFALLAEFWLYAFYFGEVLRNKTIRRVIRIYLWTLPVVWGILVMSHMRDWGSLFYVIGATFTIVLSSINYYQLFTAEELVRLNTSFEFWIATGLIFFYGVNFPYLGMLHFLNIKNRPLAYALLTLLWISNSIFYLIFTYAFICVTRPKRSS